MNIYTKRKRHIREAQREIVVNSITRESNFWVIYSYESVEGVYQNDEKKKWKMKERKKETEKEVSRTF